MLEEEDMAMLPSVVSRMVSSHPMGDVLIVCGAESFYCMTCLGYRDFDVFG